MFISPSSSASPSAVLLVVASPHCGLPPLLLALLSAPLPLQILILKVNSVSRRCRDKRGEESARSVSTGWQVLHPFVNPPLLIKPSFGHPVGPTLRRNTGHWIIAWSCSPDRRSRFVCRIYWLSPSLPHFPSCFCNGFPFDRNDGICREGNSFLPHSSSAL